VGHPVGRVIKSGCFTCLKKEAEKGKGRSRRVKEE
jgi:hypothetical protein